MLFIYLPVVLIVVYYVLYYYFTRNFNYWKKKNVVGPKPVALYGNFKEAASRRQYLGHVLQTLHESFPEERMVGIYRMTTPALLVRDLDLIKQIFIKDFELFKDRGVNFSNKGLGKNMFHADAESWTVLRSRINPMFTPGKLKNMFHLVKDRADIFISHLERQCRTNHECNIYSSAQNYTVSTIFSCAFGVDIDPFESEVDDALKTLDQLILTPSFAFEIDMMYPGIFAKLNLSLFPKTVTSFFEKLVTDIITKRKGTPSTRNDFMDLFIQMRQTGEVSSAYSSKQGVENKPLEITDDIIISQAFVFYVGGYETSATTISFLLYQLAKNPEIQEKIRSEINKVTKAYNGETTYESLNEMKYLEQAFAETLRMYPVVEPIQRMALADYKIPTTDVVIEKGKMVYVSAFGVHYDEKHYPNPHVFDPDRFDPELTRTRHPCAYLPFGVGPRNCIGMRFGSIQGRMAVAKILSKFRVEPCTKTESTVIFKPDKLLLGPKNGMFLNLVPLESK